MLLLEGVEQKYLDLLAPRYNINRIAGGTPDNTGRILSSEHKAKLSAANTGSNNAMYGMGHLLSGSKNHLSMVVVVQDILGNTIAIFPTQRTAAKWLETDQPYVHRLIKRGNVFRGKYIVTAPT